MAQDTIDKIIHIQFKYSDLIKGWAATSAAIGDAKVSLQAFKKAGDTEGVAKQTSLIKALGNELKQYTKELQDNIKVEMQASGSVNQLNARISKLTAQYKAMSGEVRKSSLGESVAKEIREMQVEVNAANEALLNFHNSVGNYANAAKGFTPLSFQVQQLAREMPSLTMSLQQFFLAISNNVPMFVDELKRARVANKALRAEGQATIPVFKQVLMSIISWQTALVVGITLLTAYGKEIGAWVKGLFAADNALSATTQYTQEFNRAIENSRSELKREFEALNNAKKGTSEYAAARKVIEDKYGDYLSNQREEIRSLEDQKAAYDALAGSITATAIAKGLEESNANAAKEYGEAMDKAFEGVQDKFIKKFGKDAGIAYFTEFRAGLNSEIPELQTRAREIYALFEDAPDGMNVIDTWREIFSGGEIGSTTHNVLESTVGKVTAATDQFNETLSANQVAMKTLMDMYKISTDDIEDQGEAIQDLIKLKEKELADINKEVATSEAEIASRNKRAEAVEKEIKRLQELGRTNTNVANGVKQNITLQEQWARAVKAARESAVKDITAIGNALEKELADTFKEGDSDITEGFEAELKKQTQVYQNRITQATLSGGNYGAARETIAIAKEQLAQLDNIADNEELVNRLGWDDVELQRQRLDLRMQIANAEQDIAREQDRTAQESARHTAQTLGALSNMTGSFSAMFDALGGEGERYAEFSKALAVFQVILAQAEAIANAVAGGSKAPWFMIPITIASSIAAVIAAMAQATQSLDSAKAPKYASGGLVTGPGTGTSDSIAARLSNGEAVMTARAVNNWGAMLSAMNVASGGNAISVSNLPQRNDAMKGLERMFERAFMNMPASVVSVVDINKGQKRVKVQNNLGRLSRKKYA